MKIVLSDCCICFVIKLYLSNVILSETPSDLQHALNDFFVYCETCKLHVNVKKTKIVIFLKGPAPKHTFKFSNKVIEIVKEFNYLGILFSRLGSFCNAKKPIFVTKHKKPCMYGIIIRKIRLYNLPFDCQLDLFDKVVTPVLLYGCEIWGFENVDII